MNYTKVVFIIILSFPYRSFCWDAPGYLGKKTSVGAYVCYMSDYFAKSQSLDTRDYHFNQKSILSPTLLFSLQLSRVISDKVELSFQAEHLRYGISALDKSNMYQHVLSNGNNAIYSRSSGMNYKLIARIYRDYSPPLGNYYGFGISFLNQRLTMVDYYNNDNLIQKVYDIGVCYEIGVKRHIGYNLILDYGIEGTFYLNAKLNDQLASASNFFESSIENNKKTYGRRNLVNFKLGLNYIF